MALLHGHLIPTHSPVKSPYKVTQHKYIVIREGNFCLECSLIGSSHQRGHRQFAMTSWVPVATRIFHLKETLFSSVGHSF